MIIILYSNTYNIIIKNIYKILKPKDLFKFVLLNLLFSNNKIC